MESLELDVPAVVSEHGHHQLQVLRVADVARHRREVVPIQEELS